VTTLPLFRALAADAEFRSAAFDVQWLDRRLADGLLSGPAERPEEVLLAAAGLAEAETFARGGEGAEPVSVWKSFARREALRGSSC
jgi:hypothetical protein